MTLLHQFIFYFFGLTAIASALLFVTRRAPVAAVLWLVNVMVSLAAMYVMLGADFVGVVQVIIYAGAIMVVFLFVVMLLNMGHAEAIADIVDHRWRLLGGLAGLVLLAQILTAFRLPIPQLAPEAPLENAIAPVADAFFRRHVIAFEVAGMLLVAAIVGAVVLAKRQEARS